VSKRRRLLCELPPPTDQGRVHNPSHPMLAIGFVYVVAFALLWGASSGGGATLASLGVSLVGQGVCLVAAVHWLEGVDIAHVPAKLGVAPAPARAWWAGAIAGAAALVTLRRLPSPLPDAIATTTAAGAGAIALHVVVLLLAAGWTEGFYRGFVFRALMRRHGFLISAAVSTLLLALATRVTPHPMWSAPQAWAVAAAEVPLSLAMCMLFWLHGAALGPVLLVRAAVVAATWTSPSPWPALAAAGVIFVVLRARRAAGAAAR